MQAAALSPFYVIHTQRPGPSKKMFTRERTIIKRIHVIGEPAADVAAASSRPSNCLILLSTI